MHKSHTLHSAFLLLSTLFTFPSTSASPLSPHTPSTFSCASASPLSLIPTPASHDPLSRAASQRYPGDTLNDTLNDGTSPQKESVNIGDSFEQYSAAPRASYDISRNGIIDITPLSPFLGNTTQEVFDAIAEDLLYLPTNADIPELNELNDLLQQQTSFEGIRSMLWSIPLKTPVRRYLYGIVTSYSQFFTNPDPINTVTESSALVDPLRSIIQGALQLFETRQPHPRLVVFGLQVFGPNLTFFKMDYRSHYRLWELNSCMVPLELSDFHEKVATCAERSIIMTYLVAQELEQRRSMPTIQAQEAFTLSWAAGNLRETVDSD
ncbi:MAG: hypothetical protein J3Q66DRAFT_369539 [Benniella sp.]|nr:MAG: hypothetical protein J3Q66DRAFT_369539 [Benniella sp.]